MENSIFEILYYGLTIAMVILLGSILFARFNPGRNPAHSMALRGIKLIALGTILALIGGVSLDTLSKAGILGDLAYQQIHFSIFYAGFAAILYGFGLSFAIPPSRSGAIKIAAWILYAAAVVLAAANLFNPATYVVAASGGIQHYAQQRIFFLPLFYVLAAGLILWVYSILSKKDLLVRRNQPWLGLFLLFLLAGLLREATIIPSSGMPVVDILVAFGPFMLASVCLFMSARQFKDV